MRKRFFELNTSIQEYTLSLDNLMRSNRIYLVVFLANLVSSSDAIDTYSYAIIFAICFCHGMIMQ